MCMDTYKFVNMCTDRYMGTCFDADMCMAMCAGMTCAQAYPCRYM